MIDGEELNLLHCSLVERARELGFNGSDLMSFLMTEAVGIAEANDLSEEDFGRLFEEVKKQYALYSKGHGQTGRY